MFVFEETGKPAYSEKTSGSKGENQQRTYPICSLVERTTLGPPTNTNNIIFNKSARSYVKTFYFCMCVIWYFLFVCLFFRNELLKTRQLAVTKLFNLLKLSTDDTAKYVPLLRSHFLFTLLCFNRALFVWPLHENARTKQKQQTNGNRAIWLVYRTDTNACGSWLVKRTRWWKTFPDNFLEINRYFTLTS